MDNSKVAVGYVPEKISYVYSAEQEVNVGCEWDINWGSNVNGIKEKVTPAFPVDSVDDKGMSTAKAWAKNNYRRAHYQDKTAPTPPEPIIETVNNDSITNIKLLSIEQRSGGGRAYKALIDKFYVDVREDVVLDTMLKSGVSPGGILNGEFVWAKVGAQMKLIRKGSEVHRLIIEFSSKKDLKPIKKKTLEVGGVYQTRKKEPAIFIGYVDSVKYSCPSNITNTYYSMARLKDDEYLKFEQGPIKNCMLFYTLYKFQELEKNLKEMDDFNNYYRFNFKKSHNFIEKIDQLDLGSDIIERLNAATLKSIKTKFLEYVGKVPPPSGYSKIDAYGLALKIQDCSAYLNMSKTGEPAKELFDIKKYLLFT
jgi:hypothetical protein